MAIQSYFHSYLKKKKNLKISIARAGNVIGGGDWAEEELYQTVLRDGLSLDQLKLGTQFQQGLGNMFSTFCMVHNFRN